MPNCATYVITLWNNPYMTGMHQYDRTILAAHTNSSHRMLSHQSKHPKQNTHNKPNSTVFIEVWSSQQSAGGIIQYSDHVHLYVLQHNSTQLCEQPPITQITVFNI